jgi:hypothetical protein
MGITTVYGEWKTNTSTLPTQRIISVVSGSILQVPPISCLHIYAKLDKVLLCNFAILLNPSSRVQIGSFFSIILCNSS